MSNIRIGLTVFGVGVAFMVLGALLPWYILPLYLEYGRTAEFIARVPLVVINIWSFSIPIGAILTVLGGAIYGKK
jgi:hypothetical protein